MKIFVLLSRIPYPLEKGDKLRAYNQIKYLAKHHDIYLCALSDKKIDSKSYQILSEFCKEIYFIKLSKLGIVWNIIRAFFCNLPLQCGYFYQKSTARKINKLIRDIKPDHIYAQLIRVSEYVKNIPIPKTLDYQDVLSKGIDRRITSSKHILTKCILKTEYKRLLKYENNIANFFNHKTIITAVDRDLLPILHKNSVVVIPNGVDFEEFKTSHQPKKYDIIFTGNMSYTPNVLAAEYLATEILPQIHKYKPEVNLLLCGANPAPKVKALANKYVIVTGWVDKITPYYDCSRIFVAPMQIGTGLQNKILEAMSIQLPCVCSPLATKPLLNAIAGDVFFECNTTSAYVDVILHLLENEDKAMEMGKTAYEYVKNNYNWEKSSELLDHLLTSSSYES